MGGTKLLFITTMEGLVVSNMEKFGMHLYEFSLLEAFPAEYKIILSPTHVHVPC